MNLCGEFRTITTDGSNTKITQKDGYLEYWSGSTAYSHFYPSETVSEEFLNKYSHAILSYEIISVGYGFDEYGCCLVGVWDGAQYSSGCRYHTSSYDYKKTGTTFVSSCKFVSEDIGKLFGIITHRCTAKIYDVWFGKRLQ